MSTCPFSNRKCIPQKCALGTVVELEGKETKVCALMLIAHNVMVIAQHLDGEDTVNIA